MSVASVPPVPASALDEGGGGAGGSSGALSPDSVSKSEDVVVGDVVPSEGGLSAACASM